MKKLSFVLSLACFYCFLALAAPEQYLVKTDKINIRADATISSESLGFLSKGEKVEVIDKKFNWYKIKLPKRFPCYIAEEFIKKIPGGKVITLADNINLRTRPSVDSSIIGNVKKNAIFFIAENSNKWVRIYAYPNMYGWVHKKFLSKTSLKQKPPKPISLEPKKTISNNIENNINLKNEDKK